MPRLASLGLGLEAEAAAATAVDATAAPSQPSQSQPPSSSHSRRASSGGSGSGSSKRRGAGEWGRRLWAAGIETAEELLVLAPDSAAARLLASKGPSPGPGPEQPRPVGRKELERLQAAVSARVAPPPFLHPAENDDDDNEQRQHGGGEGGWTSSSQSQQQRDGGGKRGQKRARPSSAALSTSSLGDGAAAASSSSSSSSFPLPRVGRAVRTTAWDEWRHVAGGGVGDRVLPTGCRSIDRLLARGGLPFHALCEVLGPSAAGKTQLCLSLAAQAALGLGADVVYLDSTGAFCPRRLRGILIEKALQRQPQPAGNTINTTAVATVATVADAALGRVRCLRVADDKDLLSALDCLGQRLLAGAEEHRDLRLLVVDSIRGPLAPILAQPGGPNGLYLMGVVGKMLNYLALRFGLCVVVVNGVVADRGPAHERASTGGAGGSGGGGGMHAMWGLKPALGPYWSTFPSLRLLLRPLTPSSAANSSSSSWRLGPESGGGGDEPLLCEAALYSAARQDALPHAPPANAHVAGSKRAFFMVTGAGVVDPPTRTASHSTAATSTAGGGGGGGGVNTTGAGGGGGGNAGVVPPYQPHSARGGT